MRSNLTLMRSEFHLLSGGIIFLVLYFADSQTALYNLIPLAVVVYIFSLLPDIDNAASLISKSFFLVYLGLFIYDVYRITTSSTSIPMIILPLCLMGFHLLVARFGRRHRSFPHTYTFGILCSLILLYFTSFYLAIAGFSCFVMHLALDSYMVAAVRNDMRLWGGILKR